MIGRGAELVEKFPARPIVVGELRAEQFRVATTSDDALWCARGLVGEAGEDAAESPEGDAVLSTWIRRFTMLTDARLRRGDSAPWQTLTDLVRAHSQPINPRWAAGGDLAERHPDRATESHLRRRERMASLGWEEIPRGIRELVVRTLAGHARLGAPTSIDFASPTLLERYGADWGVSGEPLSLRMKKRLATFDRAIRTKHASEGGRYVHVAGTHPASNFFMSTALSRSHRDPLIVPAGPFDLLPLLAALGAVAVAVL